MNDTERKLLMLLSDGEFHSGEDIGTQFGMTRSAIWKHAKALEKRGLVLESNRRKGYCLKGGIELLDQKLIEHAMDKATRSQLKKIIIQDTLASTNDFLMEQAKQGSTASTVCLAEQQTQGKGRRGRTWVSPYGTNIYCSLLWYFEKDPNEIAGLSLVAALAVVCALEELGINNNIHLKWPNDVLWQHKKLAGILLEMIAEPHGHCSVVIGIGINTRMNKKQTRGITQPWASIEDITGRTPERNRLTGLLIKNLIKKINEFEKTGLNPLIKEWQQYDEYIGKPIQLLTTQNTLHGLMKGIGPHGELLILHDNNQVKTYLSGEVSLRAVTKN